MSDNPIELKSFRNGDYVVFHNQTGEYVLYHMSDDKLWRTTGYELGQLNASSSQEVEGLYPTDGMSRIVISGHETIQNGDEGLGELKQVAHMPELEGDINSEDLPPTPGYENDVEETDLPGEEEPPPPPVTGEEEEVGPEEQSNTPGESLPAPPPM